VKVGQLPDCSISLAEDSSSMATATSAMPLLMIRPLPCVDGVAAVVNRLRCRYDDQKPALAVP